MSNPIRILDASLDITALVAAAGRFNEAVGRIKDDLDRDGAIQRFEYCFELSWKTMKRILDYKGVQATAPRDILRLAAREALISSPEPWFVFLEKRNKTSHIYKEDVAREVASVFPDFQTHLNLFVQTARSL